MTGVIVSICLLLKSWSTAEVTHHRCWMWGWVTLRCLCWPFSVSRLLCLSEVCRRWKMLAMFYSMSEVHVFCAKKLTVQNFCYFLFYCSSGFVLGWIIDSVHKTRKCGGYWIHKNEKRFFSVLLWSVSNNSVQDRLVDVRCFTKKFVVIGMKADISQNILKHFERHQLHFVKEMVMIFKLINN